MIGDAIVRYVLKKAGQHPLIILGINPSTADESKPDRTISKIMGFCDKWGFDSFIMLNVYPLRATKPSSLPFEFDIQLHEKNMKYINQVLSENKKPSILLAYGNSIFKRKFLKTFLSQILDLFKKYENCSLFQLGTPTKMGNPRHPLYVKYDTKLTPVK